MPSSTVDGAAPGGRANPPAGSFADRLEPALLVVFFSSLFFALTASSFDSEFWWHLAFGRWIFEHRALPGADPFDFTSAIFGAAGQTRYQLTQYWLAQVVLYGAYALGGLTGTFLLRAAVFTALFFLLYRLLRRAGAGLLLAVLLVALAHQAIVREFMYIENRPQMWSSLFFVALLLLLEHLRDGKRWAQYALPPFMVLWANLHAGYILGAIVIVIAAGAAWVARNPERKRILLSAAAAIALTGCNPSGYEAVLNFQIWRFSTPLGIFEEQPLFRYIKVATLPRVRPWLTAVFLLPLLTLLSWPFSRMRQRWDLYLIFLMTLAMGIKAQRYLVFLVPLSCLVTALNVEALRERLVRIWPRLATGLLPPAAWSALTAAAVLLPAATYARDAVRSSALRPSASFRHPAEAAADYLKRSGLRGNVFNEYGLGGYLAWRLHPELRIFIYGRMAYPQLLALYDDVMKYPRKTVSLTATGGLSFFYQKVFEENAINVVAIPAADSRSGDASALAWMLAQDDGWVLVSAQPAALVFLRAAAAPAELVRNALPKSAVYDNLIAIARGAARTSHGRASPIWRRSVALGHLGRGETAEAIRSFDEYLAAVPNDTWARQMRAAAGGAAGGGRPSP